MPYPKYTPASNPDPKKVAAAKDRIIADRAMVVAAKERIAAKAPAAKERIEARAATKKAK